MFTYGEGNMKSLKPLLLLIAVLQSFTLHAAEVERHALIIGNSQYTGEMFLQNPVNDATDMATQLQSLGYKIFGAKAQLDLDRLTLERTLNNFTTQLPTNAVALVYYAGHGAADDRDSYLIPLGANLEYEAQLPDRAVSLSSVANLLKNRSGDQGLNIILLDACRDNPLKTRGFNRGLKQIGGFPLGTFIGYAASEGQVAADGTGRSNGVYTGELLNALRTSADKPIESVHKAVAESVYRKTNQKQLPAADHQFIGEYCFAVCGSLPPPKTKIETPNKAFSITTNEQSNPPPAEKSNVWAAVLGAVLVGALVSQIGGDSNPPQPGFVVRLNPPSD